MERDNEKEYEKNFNLRFPTLEMKEKIVESAKKNNRSINSEIINRLTRSLRQSQGTRL